MLFKAKHPYSMRIMRTSPFTQGVHRCFILVYTLSKQLIFILMSKDNSNVEKLP